MYKAAKAHLQGAYGENSFSQKTGEWVGLNIRPSPDYAMIARASYANGQMVKDPSEVKSALRYALDQVRSGKPMVLDVKIGA